MLLFRNFNAANKKRNLSRFGLFMGAQNINWIDDNPFPLPAINTLNFTTTPVFDADTGDVLSITLTGNVTSSSIVWNGQPSIPTGAFVTLRIQQDATGGRTFAFPPTLHIDPLFVVDPAPRHVTVIPIIWNGSNWESRYIPFSFVV